MEKCIVLGCYFTFLGGTFIGPTTFTGLKPSYVSVFVGLFLVALGNSFIYGYIFDIIQANI
jgi:hypothetical protein